MVRTSGLSNEQRRLIVALRQEGVSVAQIADRCGVCRQTVYRVCKRYEDTENSDKRPRPCRSRKTTPREGRYLLRQARMTQFDSAQTLAAHWSDRIGRRISKRTTQRRLYSYNLHTRISRRKILISRVNRLRRIRWATRVRDWTLENNWRHFVFSDESRFCLSSNDGRVRVWREPNTSYDPRNLTYTQRGSVSVMVWGCVGLYGVGDLVVVDGNIDNAKYLDILDSHLFPSIANIFGYTQHPFVFQDDNAPAHRAAQMDQWYDESGVNRVQ